MIVTIEFKGVEMDVEGTFTPYDHGDYYTPPSGGIYEIESVKISDVDVTDLVDCYIDEIENECLKELEDEY